MATKVVSDEGNGLKMATKEASDASLVERLNGNIENQSHAKKTPESKLANRRNRQEVVFAPELDEVNNDKDALATLRGEGRYFGVTDPDLDKPICSNCQRRGHIRNQCKVVVCHACGKVDDHYESQCPNSMVCLNCGEKGHFRNNCSQKRKHLYCQECESHNHTSDNCPTIWRDYIIRPVTKETKIPYPSATIFCYNCAEKGHFGDECRLSRTSKTPNLNGSAFSGENLPKSLIGQYFTNFKNNNGQHQKRRYEDAFSNYNYMPPPSYNRNRNIPQAPSKSGFLPMRPQARNYNGSNYSANKNTYSNNNNNNNNYNNNRSNNYRKRY